MLMHCHNLSSCILANMLNSCADMGWLLARHTRTDLNITGTSLHPLIVLAKTWSRSCQAFQGYRSDGNSLMTAVIIFLQEQLDKEQQSHANEAGLSAQLADLDSQLEAAEQRILTAKRNVLQNDMTIQKLLQISVAA